ncbi:MAG: hypothetical protein KDA94_11705 [Acidimicrobiales bacterium]|nr:hypothetical protein [Acidimicrobiales bacterium]
MGSGATIVLDRCTCTATSASGRFRIGREAHTVRFDGVAPEPADVAEAYAAIAQLMGMENDQRVVSLPRLSPIFLRSIERFGEVHLSLFPHHHRAPIHALRRRDALVPDPDDRRVAAFFSGGVDSFNLIEEHGSEIDDLLFVRGFDVPVTDADRGAEVLALVEEAAAALHKPLIVVDTDLREFSDPTCDWTWFSYAGLIAVSMLLGRTHREVLCAASVADRHLPEQAVRQRSGPIGNRRAHLRIEGRTRTRVEKLAAVAASGAARATLRVCWQNQPGTVNCGACHKCLRTAAALEATGMLGEIDTLPDAVDFDLLATHPARTRSDRAYLDEIREVAVANGRDALAAALDAALAAGGVAGP